MFADAIKTLSDMAINEAGLDLPKTAPANLLEEYSAMINSLPVLTEDQTRFTVEMVPVRANRQYGRYLIEMTDLSRYMITNHIHDVKEAIGNILEYNNLAGQYGNVGIIIEADDTTGVEPLGYNYNAPKEFPKGEYFNSEKTLGYGLLGKETNLARVRQIANSKRFMDVLTGRYGLPLFRKGYTDVGLMQEAASEDEDVKLDKKDGEAVLQEKDNKKDKEEKCDCGKEDCPICNPKDEDKDKKDDKKDKKKDNNDEDKEAEKTEQPGDEDGVQESSMFYRIKNNSTNLNEHTMSDHDIEIQRIKDIMAGKYDNDGI